MHIEAEPNAGSGFVQWEGDPAIAGSRDTDIAEAALGTGTEVIARFAPCGAPYTITDGEADLAASTVGGPLVGWVEDDGRADLIVSETADGVRYVTTTATTYPYLNMSVAQQNPDNEISFRFAFGPRASSL